MDFLLNLAAVWLMPATPWLCRACAHGFWRDGFLKGAAVGVPVGGVAGYVCLLLARLMLWLIRKKDRR